MLRRRPRISEERYDHAYQDDDVEEEEPEAQSPRVSVVRLRSPNMTSLRQLAAIANLSRRLDGLFLPATPGTVTLLQKCERLSVTIGDRQLLGASVVDGLIGRMRDFLQNEMGIAYAVHRGAVTGSDLARAYALRVTPQEALRLQEKVSEIPQLLEGGPRMEGFDSEQGSFYGVGPGIMVMKGDFDGTVLTLLRSLNLSIFDRSITLDMKSTSFDAAVRSITFTKRKPISMLDFLTAARQRPNGAQIIEMALYVGSLGVVDVPDETTTGEAMYMNIMDALIESNMESDTDAAYNDAAKLLETGESTTIAMWFYVYLQLARAGSPPTFKKLREEVMPKLRKGIPCNQIFEAQLATRGMSQANLLPLLFYTDKQMAKLYSSLPREDSRMVVENPKLPVMVNQRLNLTRNDFGESKPLDLRDFTYFQTSKRDHFSKKLDESPNPQASIGLITDAMRFLSHRIEGGNQLRVGGEGDTLNENEVRFGGAVGVNGIDGAFSSKIVMRLNADANWLKSANENRDVPQEYRHPSGEIIIADDSTSIDVKGGISTITLASDQLPGICVRDRSGDLNEFMETVGNSRGVTFIGSSVKDTDSRVSSDLTMSIPPGNFRNLYETWAREHSEDDVTFGEWLATAPMSTKILGTLDQDTRMALKLLMPAVSPYSGLSLVARPAGNLASLDWDRTEVRVLNSEGECAQVDMAPFIEIGNRGKSSRYYKPQVFLDFLDSPLLNTRVDSVTLGSGYAMNLVIAFIKRMKERGEAQIIEDAVELVFRLWLTDIRAGSDELFQLMGNLCQNDDFAVRYLRLFYDSNFVMASGIVADERKGYLLNQRESILTRLLLSGVSTLLQPVTQLSEAMAQIILLESSSDIDPANIIIAPGRRNLTPVFRPTMVSPLMGGCIEVVVASATHISATFFSTPIFSKLFGSLQPRELELPSSEGKIKLRPNAVAILERMKRGTVFRDDALAEVLMGNINHRSLSFIPGGRESIGSEALYGRERAIVYNTRSEITGMDFILRQMIGVQQRFETLNVRERGQIAMVLLPFCICFTAIRWSSKNADEIDGYVSYIGRDVRPSSLLTRNRSERLGGLKMTTHQGVRVRNADGSYIVNPFSVGR